MGVIFFLYRLKDVVQYVHLFTIGHSVTLLVGVLEACTRILSHRRRHRFSVVYKAFENMDGSGGISAFNPNARGRLVFRPVHGFGLATKLQDFALARTPRRKHPQLHVGVRSVRAWR